MATKYAKHATDHRERALDLVGTKYPAGWCLRFVLSEIFGAPGIGDWDGDGAADAEDYLKAAKRAGTLNPIEDPEDVPAGALVLWTGGRNDHGHAAYSLGEGGIVSTDLPKAGRVGRVHIDAPNKYWGLALAGWVTTAPTGHRLNKGKAPAPAKPTTTRYRVTARSGLRGRAGATTRSRVLASLRYGQHLDAVAVVEGGGLKWAVTAAGHHYALKYLRQV